MGLFKKAEESDHISSFFVFTSDEDVEKIDFVELHYCIYPKPKFFHNIKKMYWLDDDLYVIETSTDCSMIYKHAISELIIHFREEMINVK